MSSQKVAVGKKRRRTGESSSQSQKQNVASKSQEGGGATEEVTQESGCSSVVGKRTYENMDASSRSRKVSELVRYLLFSHGRKIPVKRKELVEKVLGEDNRAFTILLEEANRQLESVFGFKAVEISRSSSKTGTAPPSARNYILVSTLPLELTQGLILRSKAEREEMGLLSVILSLIMMKQSSISEDQLWNCLGRLGLAADAKHPKFGDIKRLISVDFVSQMYLDMIKVATGEKHSISYGWGPRAKAEIDKEQLLAFVAEIYEGNLEQWKRQFADLL